MLELLGDGLIEGEADGLEEGVLLFEEDADAVRGVVGIFVRVRVLVGVDVGVFKGVIDAVREGVILAVGLGLGLGGGGNRNSGRLSIPFMNHVSPSHLSIRA